MVPSGSVPVTFAKMKDWPVRRVVVFSVKVTLVGGLSLIVFVATALVTTLPLALLVALTYTGKLAVMLLPVDAYAWLSVVAVPGSVSTVPSPQDTLKLDAVPPCTVIVRV